MTMMLSLAMAAALGAFGPDTSNWDALRRVAVDANVRLTTTDSSTHSGRFVFADDRELMLLDVSSPLLSATSRRTLRRSISAHATVVAAAALAGKTFVDGKLTISRSGIYFEARRIAAFEDVFISFAKPDVLVVAVDRHPVRRGAAIGLLIGSFLAGVGCGGECSGLSMAAGLGIYAGVGALIGSDKAKWRLVYRSFKLSPPAGAV